MVIQADSRQRFKGLVAGAAIGAILRFFVAFIFILCLYLNSEQMGVEAFALALPSAVIGLIAGGAGGTTCDPWRGMNIGALISGGFCVGMVLVPIGLASRAMPPAPSDMTSALTVGLFSGLFAMIVAGGAAGSVGAWIGRRSSTPA